MRVALLGAPGAGKSTVAADAFAALRDRGHKVELVSEFAREFIAANGGIDDAYQQAFLAREQRSREETLAKVPGVIVISDSPYLINQTYAGLLAYRRGKRRKTPRSAHLMMELLYKEFLQALVDYDLIVFCEIPGHDSFGDGVRIHDADECRNIERLMRANIDMHGGPDETLRAEWDRKRRADALVGHIARHGGLPSLVEKPECP